MEAAIETVVRRVLEGELQAFRQKLLTDFKVALDARLRPAGIAATAGAPKSAGAAAWVEHEPAHAGELGAQLDSATDTTVWTCSHQNPQIQTVCFPKYMGFPSLWIVSDCFVTQGLDGRPRMVDAE